MKHSDTECSAEWHSVLSVPWVAYIFISGRTTVIALVTYDSCDLQMEGPSVSKLVSSS